MRRVRPGSVQAAVQACYAVAGGLDNVAADVGLGASVLSRAIDANDEARPGGLGINYLDRLGRIQPAAIEPVAAHFAQLAGGFFQPLPHSGALVGDISKLTTEFAAVLQAHALAHSAASVDSNDYTCAEAQAALVDVDRLIRVAASFRAALAVKAEGGV